MCTQKYNVIVHLRHVPKHKLGMHGFVCLPACGFDFVGEMVRFEVLDLCVEFITCRSYGSVPCLTGRRERIGI